MLYMLVALYSLLSAFANGETIIVAKFPLQFSANLTLTANQIPVESDYPPRVRHMSLHYDYDNLRARVDIQEGYEAAKMYIRRYDLKREYMYRLPPIDDCKRSFLNEVMPYPLLPVETQYVGQDSIDGVLCNYFVFEEYDTRVHMYFAVSTGAPIRLLQEATTKGVSTPMLTYDFSDIVLGEPDESLFELPAATTHEKCDRLIGGFPYIHIFHYFAKV